MLEGTKKQHEVIVQSMENKMKMVVHTLLYSLFEYKTCEQFPNIDIYMTNTGNI